MVNSQSSDLEESCEVDNVNTETSEIVLAVFWKRGRLGASYYQCSTSEVYVLEDIVDVNPDFNHLSCLYNLVNPTEVVTSRGASEIFLTALRKLVHQPSSDEESKAEESTTSSIRFIGGRAQMSIEACKLTILGIRLQSEPEDISPEEHRFIMNSLLNLEKESMVSSLALLVQYLEKYLPQQMLSKESWTVLSIRHICLKNVVLVDEGTLRALQIFSPSQHPSAFKRGSGHTREGLSLFGLLGRCRSRDGTKRMREILAVPTRDLDILNARLDAIAFCCRPHIQQTVSSLWKCIGQVKCVGGILAKICQTRASVSHWKLLYGSLYNAILIGQICGKCSTASRLFLQISDSITQEVHDVAHYINQVVDFDESTLKNKFSVQSGIDKNLDAMRRTYSQVPNVLSKVAELELHDLPEFIQQCSIVCITELGYLLSVPAWLESDADTSLYQLPDFQVKFIVNKYVYYKTPRCCELDRILGDIVAQMSSVESNIMVALTQFIRRRVSAIIEALNLIAELDCVLALAEVAMQNNYVRPEIVEEPRLTIVNGRHPLQELCVHSFVPNDTNFGGNHGVMKLITGPNTSGKSVYLKQVALIPYLAHIGSFVPAESATIGLLDHIRTRIQTIESVSNQMSAFFIDLRQMLQCLFNSTERSLIVIDEFGKGTTEIDGQALLAACLTSFLERGSSCPMVLASTHFHRVPQLLPQSSLLSLQRMAYVIDGDTVVCLHKVEDGEAGSSFAHLAAKAAGLPEAALARSFQLLQKPEHCLPNPQLKVTQRMVEEIRSMKQLLELVEDPDSSSPSADGGVPIHPNSFNISAGEIA